MLNRYRQVLAHRAMRTTLIVGFLSRVPYFGVSLIVTLHVVRGMDRSYTEAGIAAAILVLAQGISGPWRGRLLDRYGLRRVILPSLFIQGAYAVAVPFLDFGPFLAAQAIGGLFYIPLQSILRQAVIAAVTNEQRRTALSLDGLMLELAAGLSPAIAVAAATTWDTGWVLAVTFWCSVASGIVLYLVNPPLRHADSTAPLGSTRPSLRSWFGPAVAALLFCGAGSTVVFAGADLSVVATLNEVGRASSIGWVMACWSLGSLFGGLLYGSLSRALNPFLLLAVFGVVVILPMFATGAVMLAALMFLTGLMSQPVLTSAVEHIIDRVPEAARGEAMGWHSTAMTTGLGLGSPAVGAVIDQWGGGSGFLAVGLFGLVTGLILWLAITVHRRMTRPATDG